MLELNKIYNMDCMAGMKQFPDNYFELAIVDPPYGIGEGNKTSHGSRKGMQKFTNYTRKKWDNEKPNKRYFSELFRISKNQIIWGANYFGLPPSKGWIFWDKNFSPEFSFSAGELAFSSFDIALKKVKIKRSQWVNCVSNNKEKAKKYIRIHPTQKPIALYGWLLKNYATAGDKILDTHLGSASSVIACIELGFDYIGFEIDKEYFENAKKRIDQFKAQTDLFRRAV